MNSQFVAELQKLLAILKDCLNGSESGTTPGLELKFSQLLECSRTIQRLAKSLKEDKNCFSCIRSTANEDVPK